MGICLCGFKSRPRHHEPARWPGSSSGGPLPQHTGLGSQGDVAKRLRRRSAKPLCGGSNPPVASNTSRSSRSASPLSLHTLSFASSSCPVHRWNSAPAQCAVLPTAGRQFRDGQPGFYSPSNSVSPHLQPVYRLMRFTERCWMFRGRFPAICNASWRAKDQCSARTLGKATPQTAVNARPSAPRVSMAIDAEVASANIPTRMLAAVRNPRSYASTLKVRARN